MEPFFSFSAPPIHVFLVVQYPNLEILQHTSVIPVIAHAILAMVPWKPIAFPVHQVILISPITLVCQVVEMADIVLVIFAIPALTDAQPVLQPPIAQAVNLS